MNRLYEEMKNIFDRYSNKRALACEILDVEGMEEAIIDELEDRGFTIIEEDNLGQLVEDS
jgi:hypothetical protein